MRKLFVLLFVALAGCSSVPDKEKSLADYENQLHIARLAEHNEQYDAALVIYKRLDEMKPRDDVSLSLGRLYYRAHEWLLVQAHLLNITRDSDVYSESRTWLAKTHLKLSQPEQALALLESVAITAEEQNIQAVSLDYLQRHNDAQVIYLSILKVDPLNSSVRKNLVYSYILSGNYSDAESQLDLLYGHGVRDKNRDILAAVVSYLNDQDKEAVNTLEEYASPMEVANFIETLEALKQGQKYD